MALFRREGKDAGRTPKPPRGERFVLVGRRVYCGVCEDERAFTQCWRRVTPMTQCACCGTVFERPAALYARVQPTCPRCAEPLEQPGSDYGICDGCGSKYEIVENTKPGLLPNRQQRAEMDKHGRSRSIE